MSEEENANSDEPVHNESSLIRYTYVLAGGAFHTHLVLPRGMATRQVLVSSRTLLARRLGVREHAHLARHRHRPLLRHRTSVQAAHEARCVLSTHRGRVDRVHIDLVAFSHLCGAFRGQEQA